MYVILDGVLRLVLWSCSSAVVLVTPETLPQRSLKLLCEIIYSMQKHTQRHHCLEQTWRDSQNVWAETISEISTDLVNHHGKNWHCFEEYELLETAEEA